MATPSPSAPRTGKGLPPELLGCIAEYLAGDVGGRRSLLAFALAGKVCYSAAKPHLFASLSLTICDQATLDADLQKFSCPADRSLYVRRVTVIGFMEADGDDLKDVAGPGRNGWRGLDGDGDGDDDSCSDGEDGPNVVEFFHPSAPRLTPQHTAAQSTAWAPFAQFLATLSGLTDLVFACAHHVPLCVLEVLHTSHPRCRLHVSAFSLRSLDTAEVGHDDLSRIIDPTDLALITSPCLYSIDCQLRSSRDWEAVAQIVSEPAAALRRVRLCWASSSFRLTPLNTEHVQQGRLESLSLYANKDDLQIWASVTNFALLRRLELNGSRSISLLKTLASIKLSSLQDLRLVNRMPSPGDNGVHGLDTDGPTASLLCAVPPLEVFQIHGRFGEATFEAALSRHGQTLRELELLPDAFIISRSRAREIQQRCPNLQTASLAIRRDHGRPEEVGIYRALGQLPRLRRATLHLECGPIPAGKYGPETVKDILTNAALDGTLARAIFHEFSAGMKVPSRSLAIYAASFGRNYGREWDGLGELVDWVGHSWVCKQVGHGTEVTARDLDGAERVKERNRQWLLEEIRVAPKCRSAWSSAWEPQGGHWADDWRSLPLTTQGCEES